MTAIRDAAVTIRRAGALFAVAVLALFTGTCAFPTDRSGTLHVEVDDPPTLFVKDSTHLTARVVDEAGTPIPNGAVTFSSDAPGVLSVDTDGQGLAVGAGTATITAAAVGFADAAPATLALRVRGLIEVDSVLPRNVRFGDSLHVFGVGLDPDSLFSVTLGGVDAPTASYVPLDPKAPNRLGQLTLFVPPPADRFATLTVLGTGGGIPVPDTILVAQRDIYEPNDTVSWYLGDIPGALQNPALAFEPVGRSDSRSPADWYSFTNAQVQDRTIVVFSDVVGAQTFSVFVTDSLGWSSAKQDYVVGSSAWTIGPQLYLCDGLSVTRLGQPVKFAEQVFPFTIISLADLPVGKYHILVPYVAPAQPRAYQMAIATGYFSTLPQDAAEENDYCDVAPPLAAAPASLTIDNPHDIDWFTFSVSGLPKQVTVQASAAGALSPNLPNPDLDLYLVADFRPDSLVLVAAGTSEGPDESVSAALIAGNYFLVVVDFPGSPTAYTLTPTFAAAPAGSAVTARGAPSAGALDAALQRKRDAAGAAGPPLLRRGLPLPARYRRR